MSADQTGQTPVERFREASAQVEHHRTEQGRWADVRREAIAEMRQTMSNAAVAAELGISPSAVTKLTRGSWAETTNDGVDSKDPEALLREMLRRRAEIMQNPEIVHAWQVAEKLGAYAHTYYLWKRNTQMEASQKLA